MARKRRYTDKQMQDAVSSSISVAQVLKQIGLSPTGANYKSIKLRCKELNISTAHFKGQGWLKGGKCTWNKKRSLDEILVKNSDYTSSNHLRNRLIKEKVFEEKCSRCGLTEWLEEKIPLQLDHKNGDNRDHRLSNLRLLCANCHALTDTYAGKNMNRKQGREGSNPSEAI